MGTKKRASVKALTALRGNLSPRLFREVELEIGGQDEIMDNQNQNQGNMEQFSRLKPDVLKEITVGFPDGDELMDNQNQNQGRLEDLLKLKPEVLRQIKVSLSGGDELMDNQNQNQGYELEALSKPVKGFKA